MLHAHEGIVLLMNSPERFLELFDENADELFRHSLMRLGSRVRAEEITRRTFENVWAMVAAGASASLDDCFRMLDELILNEYKERIPTKNSPLPQPELRYGFIRTAQ